MDGIARMSQILLPLQAPASAKWLGHDRRPALRVFAVTTACVALVLLGSTLAIAMGLRTELQDAEQNLADAQERLALSRAPSGPSKPTLTRDQIAGLNSIIRLLNVPWPSIFDALERQTPPNVALVAIEPDSKRSAIRIEAEARRADELLEYAEMLEKDPAILRVLPIRHETREQPGGPVARLVMDALLVPVEPPPQDARHGS